MNSVWYILKSREQIGKETMVRLLSRPCQQNPTCALTLLHMSSGAQPWPSASAGSLSGGVRLAGLRCVCVHEPKTPHLQQPVVRVLAMATTPVGSCSNLGSLMRAVSLKPHLGCFCFAHVMGRKCSYVTFLFAGCRKICVHVEYQNSKFDFFKKETHLFL